MASKRFLSEGRNIRNLAVRCTASLHSLQLIDLKDNVPATLRTLEKTAEYDRSNDVEVIWFDVGALLQGEERVHLLRMNWLNKMQFMFMNADVPVDAWNFNDGFKLYFKNGERAWGGKTWNNDLWMSPGKCKPQVGYKAAIVFKVGEAPSLRTLRRRFIPFTGLA